jgi:hypothetical protein
MDIGVWMSKQVLAHKLEARHEKNPEQAWNLSKWPTRFSEQGVNRLFVAAEGKWRGYFILSDDALYNPNDTTSYTILFDTRTWKSIPPTPVNRFRSFTYKTPLLSDN